MAISHSHVSFLEVKWTPIPTWGGWLTEWYMDRRFRLARANGTMELDAGATAEYLHRLAGLSRYGWEWLIGFMVVNTVRVLVKNQKAWGPGSLKFLF